MEIKGRINLEKVDLMGYTFDNQEFYVRNAGGEGSTATFNFLEGIRQAGWLPVSRHGMLIGRGRIEAFKDYCSANGFEVVMTA